MTNITQADRDAAIDLDELHIIQVWNIDRVAAAFAEHRQAAIEAQAAEIERLRQPQTDALKMAREALGNIASIKADDGDDFSKWPDDVVIRCEITVADLKAIRNALDALGFEIREKGR